MLETVLSLIPAPVLNALGTGAATVPATWGLIEYVFPRTSPTTGNRLTNVGVNVGIFTLLHASGQVAYGGGWQGYLAAGTYGLMSAGLTDLFHRAVKRVAPGVTRPADGG